ncbi:hypothetical protein KPL70_003640 [Citrus sinensis]|nr:hypothetical protein KPL70_003640 [Citrus sinensis]
MMLSTALSSPNITLKPQLDRHLKTYTLSRFWLQTHKKISPLSKTRSLEPIRTWSSFLGFSGEERFGFSSIKILRFSVNADNGGGAETAHSVDDEAERLARGESTMPERFRHLTKEAPDVPVKWPWFIGDPLTSLIFCLETAIYSIRAFYSGIVAYTPVGELTFIIMLASAVLSIGEATVPNAISCQPYLLTLSGLIGYAVVGGQISEPFFWTLLLGMYGFSRLIKKRDDVTSALPPAAALAAVGEPWVRVLAMAAYLALAIFHHSKKLGEGKEEVQVLATKRKVPLPLFGAALAIGIRVTAKWAGYRHLTWMIT